MNEHIKILVVEDDLLVQTIESRILKKLSYGVELAKTGEEAINLFFANKFDFVFMDIGLPDMTGIEVTKRIREKDTITPIVALTAHAEDERKKEAFAAGMTDYLVKPLTEEIAPTIINKYVNK